jgi:hypothetical protein
LGSIPESSKAFSSFLRHMGPLMGLNPISSHNL